MKRHLGFAIILGFVTLCWSLFVPTWPRAEEYPTPVEIRQLLSEVDSLLAERQLDTAFVLAEMALSTARQHLGESDSMVASALNLLGKCYYYRAAYAECESLLTEALIIRQELLGPDHPDVAASLSNLGSLCYHQAKYEEAKAHHRRALEIREEALGPDHMDVARSLNNLAVVFKAEGKYAEAQVLFERSLEIRENTLGPDHPDLATALNGLGALYMNQGKYTLAEPLYKRALGIRERVLGPDHPRVATTLRNLANLYDCQGRYVESERLCRRALEITEAALGPDHPSVAKNLNSLASVCRFQLKYSEAESFHKRALNIRERVLGPDHPDVAQSLNNLANLYYKQGRYEEARPLYKRALDIKERIVGAGSPGLAQNMNNLAALYMAQGDYAQAIQLTERALGIVLKTVGEEHREVAVCWSHLAQVHAALGENERSLEYYKKAQQWNHGFVEYVFSYASEDQKMRYTELYPLLDHGLISFAVATNSADSRAMALEMLLKGKAAVIDAISVERKIAYCSYDDGIQDRVRRHAEVCGEISTLILAGTQGLDSEENREHLHALYRTKDSLEIELSSSCAEFRDELAARRFTMADVAGALPDGAVLLEFVRYSHRDITELGDEVLHPGSPRYAVLTLDYMENTTLIDLGDAQEIDNLVGLARERIYRARFEVYSPMASESERRLNLVTGRLFDILFAPVESSLGTSTDIFISPDGQLSLLPFEILPCPDGEYMIEKYRISYLSSGRDLLRYGQKQKSGEWALAMADPDFSLSEHPATDRDNEVSGGSYLFSGVDRVSRGVSNCFSASFDPLPLSRQEAESVSKILQEKAGLRTEVLCGADALEETLKAVTTAPRVLHLATHGYFCEDLDLKKSDMLENPLLRSGLALAGANRVVDSTQRPSPQVEDGVLTAFEASGLNLVGTELVVLSACESGVGQVRNGEGVFGLRRAFQCAGARTVVMSLWKIPDKETTELMNAFYGKWLTGQTKKEALRQSALEVLRACRAEYGISHPLFWGGFVVVGAPD